MFLNDSDKVQSIINICFENNIKPTGNVFKQTPDEIKKIVELCRKNNIKPEGTVFNKKINEIEDIVNTCIKNNIKPIGNVFKRNKQEIEDIIKICNYNNLKIMGNIFQRTPNEVTNIINLCNKNNIKISGTIFNKKPNDLLDTIEYIKKNYDSKYLTSLIVVKDVKYIENVFSYLDELGVLEYVINSSSILSLTLPEIKYRKDFIESIGEDLVLSNGKFNSIFGMIRKNFNKKVESYNNKTLVRK